MTDSRLVFLTGATGFIGGRLAAALAARGCRLRCLVRDPARAGALTQLGAELIEADITDAAAMRTGVADADVAIHLAAVYDVGVVDAPALERSNVLGTRTFLGAAHDARVPRTIYVSSIVALGPVPDVGDESSSYDGPYPTVYHRTKTEAHRLARAAQQHGDPLMIACPGYVYGPGDEGPAGRFFEDLLTGRVPALPSDSAWLSFVHVDDVVAGLIAMLERGRPGESYVLGGEFATLNDFAERAAAVAGVRAPRLRMPRAPALLMGSALDAISRATGKRFPLSREAIASVTGGRWLHSHEKAARELGYAPRSIADGLPETLAWTRAEVERKE